ncbi:MAG: hypothetical protein IPN03_06410, partial [Holophagales bacterium]|nr:hypothetical protein [Holophagales bacterium]
MKTPALAARFFISTNRVYLEMRDLQAVEVLGRGVAWLWHRTHASLLQAANFMQAIEERHGLKVACPRSRLPDG